MKNEKDAEKRDCVGTAENTSIARRSGFGRSKEAIPKSVVV